MRNMRIHAQKRIGPFAEALMKLRLTCVYLAFCLAAAAPAQVIYPLQTPRFAHIYIFGDSLSDTGNVYTLTFHTYPAPPYWNGRFSNGPVWVESLGNAYGLTIRASLVGGTNYAYGGAETGTGASHSGTPNADSQINSFTSNVGSFGATDLAILWIGGNDLINGQNNVSIPTTNIYNECVRLKNLGAKYILVGNLPLLGYAPRYFGTANQDPMNALTQTFNSALDSRIASFRASFPSVLLFKFVAAAMFNAIRFDPASYGIADVTHSYLATNQTENPDTYLFWDDLHPTRAAHAILASQAYYQFGGIRPLRVVCRK